MRSRRLHWIAPALLTALLAAGPARADGDAEPERFEDIPSATTESVARALAKVRRKYGADAVVLETNLLLHAMRSGSQLATGVRVAGVKTRDETEFLHFDLETGLVFDDATRDVSDRIQMLWATILAPTLQRLTQLEIPAQGILVLMELHHRPYASQADLRETLDAPGTLERIEFSLLTNDVRALIDARVTAPQLLTRARVSVDGEERPAMEPAAAPPLQPGPL